MILLDDYATMLHYHGSHLGEVRKNQADMLMNATFKGDVGYRHVYILDPEVGWHYTDAKFSKHSNPSLAKDAVDSYLQFRPKEHHPVGTYVFIPSDQSYRMNINEDDPLNGDVSDLWMIIAKNDSKQFVRYLVIRCNWRFKWVVGYGDQKKIYDCWGALRSANSYTSGIWNDYKNSPPRLETARCIPLNCWKILRALLPQRDDEICVSVMVKNNNDWIISSQASNRRRFNDHRLKCRQGQATQSGGNLKHKRVMVNDMICSRMKVREIIVVYWVGQWVATISPNS